MVGSTAAMGWPPWWARARRAAASAASSSITLCAAKTASTKFWTRPRRPAQDPQARGEAAVGRVRRCVRRPGWLHLEHRLQRPGKGPALCGVASKRCYGDRGLAVATGLGRKCVEFATASRPVKLVRCGRRALAIDADVSLGGTGSYRLMICSDAGPFTGPDGLAWDATAVSRATRTALPARQREPRHLSAGTRRTGRCGTHLIGSG